MTNTIEIESDVVEVTLHEDRAHVRRVAQVELPAAPARLRALRLAPVLADKTLTARFEAGGRVLDTSVERKLVVLDDERPAEAQALEVQRRTLERERARITHTMQRLDIRRSSFERMAALQIDDIVLDARWNRTDASAWRKGFGDLAEDEEKLIDEIVQTARAREETERKIADLDVRIEATATPSTRRQAAVTLDVHAQQAGPHTIIIEYVVPAACWRPHHRAELRDGAVVFSTDASVWQNTGEDWTDARLVFSTERPSLGSKPPPLTSDVLRAEKKGPEVEVETREQEVETAGIGGRRKVELPDVPGIDDGGNPMVVHAPARATIRSNGAPHRVPITTFTCAATTSLVLMAELAPAVILKSVQSNDGPSPLLPGPVDLIRDSGLVGRTTVKFVAVGERFELGWGPDASLRVVREVRDLEAERRILSSWTKVPRLVEVHVSNIGHENKHIDVTERVIVSEIEKVKIAFDSKKTSERKSPDSDGFVRWTIDVPAAERRSLQLSYLLEKHSDVVGI